MKKISIIKTLQKRRFKISVTSTSTYGSYDVIKLLNFAVPSYFRTNNEDSNSSITFDFGTSRGCIESYAIRTVNNDHYPIKWEIQGSNDDENYVVLDERSDYICKDNLTIRPDYNIYVCGAYVTKIYEVKNRMCIRYLRMQQIGENSLRLHNPNFGTGCSKVLYLSGFDVYGVPMFPYNQCFQTQIYKFKVQTSLCALIILCLS